MNGYCNHLQYLYQARGQAAQWQWMRNICWSKTKRNLPTFL
jgi:hypothetical protein